VLSGRSVKSVGYATRNRRPPRTLTEAEVARLLKVTGEHVDGFRDHVILAVALGSALRESEICGLDVGDVTNDGRTPKRTIQLRVFKRGGGKADASAQRVPLSDGAYYKLEKWLRQHCKGLPSTAPLFSSRHSQRLSARRVRSMFRGWQIRAGFDKPYPFHSLRHTCLTNLLRECGGNLKLVQKVARHANIETTAIYTHPSDDEAMRAVKRLAS